MRKIDSLVAALLLLASLPLAAFSLSWIQANATVGLFRGPGDFAASGIPMVLLLVVSAVFHAVIGMRLWVTGLVAIAVIVPLVLTWIAHLGGQIYDIAGLVHSVLVVTCIALMVWKWRNFRRNRAAAPRSASV